MGFEKVETLLESDLENFEEEELDELYNEMERYAQTAEVLESTDRYDDAEYHRELAVETYEAFNHAIQLNKEDEEYDF